MIRLLKRILGSLVLFVLTLVPGFAFAANPWDDLVAAADVAGLSTSITGILVLMIGLYLIFAAYRWVRRSLR